MHPKSIAKVCISSHSSLAPSKGASKLLIETLVPAELTVYIMDTAVGVSLVGAVRNMNVDPILSEALSDGRLEGDWREIGGRLEEDWREIGGRL